MSLPRWGSYLSLECATCSWICATRFCLFAAICSAQRGKTGVAEASLMGRHRHHLLISLCHRLQASVDFLDALRSD